MSLLFIALGVYGSPGGIERFNRRIVRCLAELSPGLVASSMVIALRDHGTEPIRRPEQIPFVAGRRKKWRVVWAFAWHTWRTKPDVILYGHVLLAPLAGLARLLSPRTRHVLFVHGVEVWSESYRFVPNWERWIVRRWVDRIVAVSQFTRRRMQQVYGVPSRRFSILPNATDVEAPSLSKPRSRRLGHRPLRLLTVARLGWEDRYKGCHNVIAALVGLRGAARDARYCIVGEGPLRTELQALAEALEVADRVELVGYVDDDELHERYEQSDVFIMTSTMEGFGIVFLEAWAHGLPVIAGNVDASAEVVSNGLNGVTVDPNSVDQIREAIEQLASDRGRLVEMGERGYETVCRQYAHEPFRHRFAGIIGEVADRCAG